MKNSTNINVLVDGAGGDVGQGVIKSLLASNLSITLYASCITSTSSWLHKVDNSYVFPYISSENFIEFLISFLNKHQIAVYFPTVDSGILKIAQYKQLIEEKTNCIVFVDELKKVRICDDKYETIVFLQENGFNAPLSILPKDSLIQDFIATVGYPFIVKTRSGYGANEVFLITKENDYKRFVNDMTYMFQQYIPKEGGEYTSGIYLGDDNEIKGICTFKRELRCGSTYKAERIIDENLERPLRMIARKLGLKYLNIQSMKKGDSLYPFEFNGRFSGTTSMVSHVFNAPEMFIREKILKEKLVPSDNQKLFFVSRYAEEVYTTKEAIDALEQRSKL